MHQTWFEVSKMVKICSRSPINVFSTLKQNTLALTCNSDHRQQKLMDKMFYFFLFYFLFLQTHITLVLVVFGSLTHGSYSCYSDNIRRITKETCLRINDHIFKRNTDFLDFGYKIKYEKGKWTHK